MAPIRDRITVIDRVYHQRLGEEAQEFPCTFSRELETTEQPYTRQLVATEEWKPLDHGWIERVGMLIVVNQEGRFLQTNPSKEQKDEAAKKILELQYEGSAWSWLIPPGESFRGMPGDITNLLIRSRSGTIKFTVHVLPI